MRKKTINFCYDKILWGLISLLPLILYAFYLLSIGDKDLTLMTFEEYLSSNSFFFANKPLQTLVENNIIASTFYQIFESGDYGFVITGDYFLSWYMMYLVTVEFMHICVDVLLILPRITNKLFGKLKHEDC